jgi:hypothetical protein
MVVTIESDVAFRSVRAGAGEKLAARAEKVNSISNFIVRRRCCVRFGSRIGSELVQYANPIQFCLNPDYGKSGFSIFQVVKDLLDDMI